MISVRRAVPEDVGQVVDIHIKAFPTFFLTFLGPGFLKQLYLGYIRHPVSSLLVSCNDQVEITGFVAFTENASDLYRLLLRDRMLHFAWYALGAFFRSPSSLFRLVRALGKPKDSRRNEPYAELSSIAVSPAFSGQGIGGVLIAEVKNLIDFSRFSYLKLDTDAINNEPVNLFYQRQGFKLYRQYTTPEGRAMNEYHYLPPSRQGPLE